MDIEVVFTHDKNHFETLGCSQSASHEELTKAYRELSRRHHPDANPNNEYAVIQFVRVTEAYERLMREGDEVSQDMTAEEALKVYEMRFGGYRELFYGDHGIIGLPFASDLRRSLKGWERLHKTLSCTLCGTVRMGLFRGYLIKKHFHSILPECETLFTAIALASCVLSMVFEGDRYMEIVGGTALVLSVCTLHFWYGFTRYPMIGEAKFVEWATGGASDPEMDEIRDLCSFHFHGDQHKRSQTPILLVCLPLFLVDQLAASLCFGLLSTLVCLCRTQEDGHIETARGIAKFLGALASSALFYMAWVFGGNLAKLCAVAALYLSQNMYSAILFRKSFSEFIQSLLFGGLWTVSVVYQTDSSGTKGIEAETSESSGEKDELDVQNYRKGPKESRGILAIVDGTVEVHQVESSNDESTDDGRHLHHNVSEGSSQQATLDSAIEVSLSGDVEIENIPFFEPSDSDFYARGARISMTGEVQPSTSEKKLRHCSRNKIEHGQATQGPGVAVGENHYSTNATHATRKFVTAASNASVYRSSKRHGEENPHSQKFDLVENSERMKVRIPKPYGATSAAGMKTTGSSEGLEGHRATVGLEYTRGGQGSEVSSSILPISSPNHSQSVPTTPNNASPASSMTSEKRYDRFDGDDETLQGLKYVGMFQIGSDDNEAARRARELAAALSLESDMRSQGPLSPSSVFTSGQDTQSLGLASKQVFPGALDMSHSSVSPCPPSVDTPVPSIHIDAPSSTPSNILASTLVGARISTQASVRKTVSASSLASTPASSISVGSLASTPAGAEPTISASIRPSTPASAHTCTPVSTQSSKSASTQSSTPALAEPAAPASSGQFSLPLNIDPPSPPKTQQPKKTSRSKALLAKAILERRKRLNSGSSVPSQVLAPEEANSVDDEDLTLTGTLEELSVIQGVRSGEEYSNAILRQDPPGPLKHAESAFSASHTVQSPLSYLSGEN